jgi:superoxide dismutase, Cu-Zn family
MFKTLKGILATACFLISSCALADIIIPINLTAPQGVGTLIGEITAKQTPHGVLFIPQLHDLPPGNHGIHIHQNPSCLNNGMAAGDHFDPQHTEQHRGPYGTGHLGDLPVLKVDKEGKATAAILAPRIKLDDLKNHSLVIHAGGDNYADTPEKLGGGGARIACGVIK